MPWEDEKRDGLAVDRSFFPPDKADLKVTREMQRRGGLQQAVTITDAGHAMHIENPADFTRHVLAFTAAH